MAVLLLRLGHRPLRDQRTTTHCALVARAFGADGMWYTGEKDTGMEEAILGVARTWGGLFFVRHADSWKTVIQAHRAFASVHLTVYGLPYQTVVPLLRKKRNLLLIVGGGKVPKEVYQTGDYNVAVTGQPHSEVAALAILLDRLGRGARFPGAKLKVVPQERGKKVVSLR